MMRGAKRRHGHSRSTTYAAWIAMINRCECQTSGPYRYYGGRGIRICERWRNAFENFLADMGERPAPGYSLDRRDVNGHYEPGNCRWATREEQQRNKRNALLVSFRGQTRPLAEWAEQVGIDPATLHGRLFLYGWEAERALMEPIHKEKRHVART